MCSVPQFVSSVPSVPSSIFLFMAEDLPEVPFVHVSYNPAEGLTLAGPAADESAPDDSVPHITYSVYVRPSWRVRMECEVKRRFKWPFLSALSRVLHHTYCSPTRNSYSPRRIHGRIVV